MMTTKNDVLTVELFDAQIRTDTCVVGRQPVPTPGPSCASVASGPSELLTALTCTFFGVVARPEMQ